MQIPPPPPGSRRVEAALAPGLLGDGITGGGGQGLLAGGSGLDALKNWWSEGEYRPLGGGGKPAAPPYQLDPMNPLSMMSGGGEPALSVGGYQPDPTTQPPPGGDTAGPDPTLLDSVSMQAPHSIRGGGGPGLLADAGIPGSGGADVLGAGAPPADDGSNANFFSRLFGGGKDGGARGDWGPALMQLGGGIAAGATEGWGAGIGKGLGLAGASLQRSKEQNAEEQYRKDALAVRARELAKQDIPSGYQPDGKGGLTFIPHGPADPEAAAALTSARAAAQYEAGVNPEDVNAVVDGMEDGTQPPITTGLYKMSPRVRGEAARRKFDLAGAQLQWEAAKRQVATLNQSQMTRFVGLNQSVTGPSTM